MITRIPLPVSHFFSFFPPLPRFFLSYLWLILIAACHMAVCVQSLAELSDSWEHTNRRTNSFELKLPHYPLPAPPLPFFSRSAWVNLQQPSPSPPSCSSGWHLCRTAHFCIAARMRNDGPSWECNLCGCQLLYNTIHVLSIHTRTTWCQHCQNVDQCILARVFRITIVYLLWLPISLYQRSNCAAVVCIGWNAYMYMYRAKTTLCIVQTSMVRLRRGSARSRIASSEASGACRQATGTFKPRGLITSPFTYVSNPPPLPLACNWRSF